MKVFRKLRSGRRRSPKNSMEANMLLSDSAYPSEGSSVSSWGEGSSLSGSANHLFLVTEYHEGTSNDDNVTDVSSLPAHIEDFQDHSPSNWSSSSIRNEMAMMMYAHPNSPRPLPDSIKTWFRSVDALIRSREMKFLLRTSRDLVVSVVITSQRTAFTAGGMVLGAALLPVTIPLHVASTATCLAVGVTDRVIHKVLGGGQSSGEEGAPQKSPIDTFIHNVFNIIPFVVNTAGKITSDVGSAAVKVVAPVLGVDTESKLPAVKVQSSPTKACATTSGESIAEREKTLQRLRLDFQLPTEKKESPHSAFNRATPSDVSKNLLRVDDIVVMVSPDPAMANNTDPRRALFVDIGSEFSDEAITSDALAQLIQRGLDVTATNASAHFGLAHCQIKTSISIDWKPEGQTGRLIRKMAQVDQEEYYRKLNSHVLVWSGKYNGSKYHGSDNPLFLARGVVRRSPREFFDMLWDSNRTGEYNHFSLGRSDTLILDDGIFCRGTSAAKVIRSDTRVPFAGITVTLSALMHGKKFKEGLDEGYVIVSRSLNCGMAGCHVGQSNPVDKNNKNEILLGVNIMRPVPGHPQLTDLMSVSQVSSSMVPHFLTFRIGMMGLEDFFSNVRKL